MKGPGYYPSYSDMLGNMIGTQNAFNWVQHETPEEAAARRLREWLRGPEYPADRQTWPFPGQPDPTVIANAYGNVMLWILAILSVWGLSPLVWDLTIRMWSYTTP